MLGRAVAAAAVVLGCATASAQEVKLPGIDFGRYHALVIGNNDYEHLPRLKSAVVDAVAVAEMLRLRYGFQAKLLLNATRLQILEAMNAYRRDLTERDNLLIYYAGHGVLDRETDTGFWLPVDAKPDSDSFWIPNTDLSRRLRAITARHVMVVADSCYSGTLVREASAALPTGLERSAWLERMNRLVSRTALVSGGLEPVTDGGGGNHSVFAKAFLNALRGNSEVIDGQALFRSVSRPVVLNAPDQTPRYSDIRAAGHEGGEFLFVPRDVDLSASVATKPSPTTARDASAFELTFWQSIQSSRNPGDFTAYLRRFPNGTFVDLARNRLRSLEPGQTASVAPPEPRIEIDPIEAEYVAVKNANVRAGPTVRAARVTTLERGNRVHVAGRVKDRNWYLVERDGTSLGYVFGDLLSSVDSYREAGQGGAASTKAEPQTARIASALSPPPLHDCDRMAAHPWDPDRVGDGVDWARLQVDAAMVACQSAVRAYPDSARFQFQLGRVFHKAGKYADAEAWYRKVVAGGHSQAQNNLGQLFLEGKGVRTDLQRALELFRQSAEQGNAIAQNQLGLMYGRGQGVTRDDAEATNWYRKAADQGYAFAQRNLGLYYRTGRGVAQDFRVALKLYRQAAEQGNALAQNDLGLMHDRGQGVAKDAAAAAEWYRKAADQGNAVAQRNLARKYRLGEGVAQDFQSALRLYRQAAAQGNANAHNDLGIMYQRGQGVAADAAEAASWYRKAADQGDHWGQFNLGLLYRDGTGVEKDDARAMQLFRQAAEQGNLRAQYSVGYGYANGNGVKKDCAEAASWYRKAADRGHASAQNNLGVLYRTGCGVKRDRAEAEKWYRKAAKQGNKIARQNLRNLLQSHN